MSCLGRLGLLGRVESVLASVAPKLGVGIAEGRLPGHPFATHQLWVVVMKCCGHSQVGFNHLRGGVLFGVAGDRPFGGDLSPTDEY